MVPKVALIRQLIGITFCPKGSEAAVEAAAAAAAESVHGIHDHLKKKKKEAVLLSCMDALVMFAKPASLLAVIKSQMSHVRPTARLLAPPPPPQKKSTIIPQKSPAQQKMPCLVHCLQPVKKKTVALPDLSTEEALWGGAETWWVFMTSQKRPVSKFVHFQRGSKEGRRGKGWTFLM